MTCSDIEILLAEFVDGTLHDEVKSAVESHLSECAACRELAQDAADAVAFIERAAVVEGARALVPRTLLEVADAQSRTVVKPSLARGLSGRTSGTWLEPVLQPRW